MNETRPDARQEELLAEQVAAYLKRHPEFFCEHDDLLGELRIPHHSGSAVSLVERQVSSLRERNNEARQRLNQLMEVARDNDRLFEKTRRLVLEILDTASLEDLVGTLEDRLRHEFKIPFVSLILFAEAPLPVGRWLPFSEAQQAFGQLLDTQKTVFGVLRSHELEFLFPEAERSQIGSAAVVPLSHAGHHGILAIGSPDPQHYKNSMGTLFLNHLAEVLARVLPRLAVSLRPVR